MKEATPDTVPVRTLRVALVTMPFASGNTPSIQIGLLAALARRRGHAVDTYHLNLNFAAVTGPRLYERLCEHRGRMTGEWLFSHAAFGDELSHCSHDYLDSFPEEADWFSALGRQRPEIAELRQTTIPRFVDECVGSNNWAAYDVVGFSTTFQQTVASLALARRIKQQWPGTKLVFGGANMEGPMGAEFHRAFPFVDFVVNGEADITFLALLECVASGGEPGVLPGVLGGGVPNGAENVRSSPTTGAQLDALPTPEYEEFFRRTESLGLVSEYSPRWSIPFETSRGCWWGERQHCVFCGLNGLAMTYRSKGVPRVLEELAELAQRHHNLRFSAVDNILDVHFPGALFGNTHTLGFDYRFFYEVKSHLKRSAIQQLKQGGVERLQPGIESLSTNVLKLMRKGSSMLQNVRFLKWCLFYDIRVDWNILWGFPGETLEDYAQQEKVISLLTHLEPPQSCSRIWVERFSPLHNQMAAAAASGRLTAEASYRFSFPSHVHVDDIAYFFADQPQDTLPDSTHQELQARVQSWRAQWHSVRRHSLQYRRMPQGLLIDVHRDEGSFTHFLASPVAEIYEACGDSAQTPQQVLIGLTRSHNDLQSHPDLKEDDVHEALSGLCGMGLMVSEEGRFLSLAIPVNRSWLYS